MPSLNRSRNERCRLGPEPVGSVGLPVAIWLCIDNVVGLPDEETVGLPLVECWESIDEWVVDKAEDVL